MPTLLARFVFLFLALLSGPHRSRAQGERAEIDAGIERLAASLSTYREARTANAGLAGARDGVVQRMEELHRLLQMDPLQRPVELARALWLARPHHAGELRGGKVTSEVYKGGSFSGAGLGYAYRLPKDYDPGQPYALVVAIPGEGEDPAAHIRASWTLREFQERTILVCPAMPTHADWERVSVNGKPGGLSHVLTALRVARERFAVDVERVFVAGHGKGVPAAVAAGNHAPEAWAGVIGRAGDAGELRPDNFVNLPTFFSGAAGKARAFGDAATAAGHDNSTFVVGGSEQDLWIWMLDHPRAKHPERVVVVPGNPFPTRAYWLQISPSASDARATGTLERATNTLRLDTHGVALATVFLNDEMLDLSRPVRVLANGAEQSLTLPRRLTAFLDLFVDGTSDAAAVYVTRAEFDLTGKEAAPAPAAPLDAEFESRFVSAAGDVAKLWDLHLWCDAEQRVRQDARALRAILLLDPEHAGARAALGHVSFAGHWFTSAERLERYRQSQDPAAAAAKGHGEYRSLWMHPDERALAIKGWLKDPETGQWLTPADQKRLAAGWLRQDLDWIAPEDAPRVDDGLWWVDGEWLDLAHANRRHAALDEMWRIPGPEVLLVSSADREVSLRAMQAMERALVDLRKVFGAEPVLPLRVGLLRDEEQYDRFAFGDPDGRRLATHAGRLHVVHSAFFAESWFPRVEGKLEFMGMGVGYWDSQVPNGDAYGVHAARLAVGLSYADALDPSPLAVRKALSTGPGSDYYAAYQAEKKLPAWLRWGGAVYAERFFEDTEVAEGGDPWWTRKWSIESVKSRGGMRALEEVLAFRLDPDQRDDSLKLMIEAGLVVAFLVDGQCAPVMAEHAALKRALAGGKLQAKHVTALSAAVQAHANELRAFAGL